MSFEDKGERQIRKEKKNRDRITVTIIGMVIFAEFPDALSVAGYVMIIGSAIIMWKYNESLAKSQ